jgi:virulence factor
MLPALLKKYNELRKEKYFRSPLFSSQKKYAFIGVGTHSLANFYPLLRHFNISLKYICTKTSDWSSRMSPLFPGCVFTHEVEDIINDKDVGGVFVCASPEAHYGLLTRLLKAGKNTFIDKPPCSDLSQLQELIRLNTDAICKVGLQRRYWPGNRYAQEKSRGAAGYIYQFHTGPYPQGDLFTELFIHPLDYCRFLFGDYAINSFSNQKDSTGTTIQMHVTHAGGTSGLLQLSTHYAWNPASESISVNTKKGSLLIQYPGSVQEKPLPRRYLNIPSERLLRQPAITKEYYSAGPSITPAMDLNTLVTQGFYDEVGAFVSLVENNGQAAGQPKNDLSSLLNVYQAIESLRAK